MIHSELNIDDKVERLSIVDGLHIEHSGQVYVAENSASNTMVSIIVKLPTILQLANKNVMTSSRCIKNAEMQDALRSSLNILRSVNDQYIKDRRALLNRYISNRREKRQLLPILGGAALLAGGTAFGISQVQVARMRQHVAENINEINDIKHNIAKLRQQTAILGRYTYGLIKEVQARVIGYWHELKCEVLQHETLANVQFNMEKTHEIFDNTVWTALSGNNHIMLTPKTLEPFHLDKVVQEMSIFDNFIYKNNPNLLYSTATLSLVDITYNLTTAHFILTFPSITRKALPFNLYKINQVGMFTPPSQCTYRATPKHVLYYNDRFLAIDLSNCVSHDNIYLCQSNALQNATSCLQPEYSECEFRYQKCSRNFNSKAYISTLAGILLRNNKIDSTFVRNHNGTISSVPISKHYTAFINWTNIMEIQIDHVSVSSPIRIGKPISIINYMTNVTIPFRYYQDNMLSNEFNRLSYKFNNTVENLLDPIFQHWQYTQPLNDSTFNTWQAILILCIANTVGIVVLTLYICGFCKFFRMCTSSFLCNFCKKNKTEKGTHIKLKTLHPDPSNDTPANLDNCEIEPIRETTVKEFTNSI